MRVPIPLKERRLDIVFLVFFFVNILFITYLLDVEQVIVTDTSKAGTPEYEYPVWPPKVVVDAAYWWGREYDALLMARPMFWRMTIWIDQLFFGPFYLVGIYAFIRGRDWIRIPSIIYASVIMTNVVIIMGEELNGKWAVESGIQMAMVIGANGPWFFIPALLIYRMWSAGEHPFTRPQDES